MVSLTAGELERTWRAAVECEVEEVARFAEEAWETGGLLFLELGSAWLEASGNLHEQSVLVEKPPWGGCEAEMSYPSFHP